MKYRVDVEHALHGLIEGLSESDDRERSVKFASRLFDFLGSYCRVSVVCTNCGHTSLTMDTGEEPR